MSRTHKGSWSRVKDKRAWDECPLWSNIEKKKEAEKWSDKRIEPVTKKKAKR